MMVFWKLEEVKRMVFMMMYDIKKYKVDGVHANEGDEDAGVKEAGGGEEDGVHEDGGDRGDENAVIQEAGGGAVEAVKRCKGRDREQAGRADR